MADIRFSIITPSFNQARFIEANITSVKNQNYPDVEHLIIDGASTDGTLEILKKYPHLTVVSEHDRGQSHALNKGFHMASGEIIGWLNSDDSYCPNIFHTVAREFKNADVCVVCGDGFEIDRLGNRVRPWRSNNTSPENLIRYWKWKYEFFQPSFFFRKKVFQEAGYLDESLYYVMDYEFFIRLGLRYTFRYLPIPLAELRMYGENKTGRNVNKIIPDYIFEMHKVSRRYWGRPTSWRYYSYLGSFIGALALSLVKNILFFRGSKTRSLAKRLLETT